MQQRFVWALASAVVGGTVAMVAQAPPRPTPVWTENSRGDGPLDRLAFRAIGPATPSGRIDDVAVLESDPSTFYVATATSGIYKTTNAGTTFTPVFDHEGSASVGDVAIAPTDPNLVWAGTGENNNRQSSSWGDGVYKSTDGGRTWKNMGLRDSKQIARIIVDPVDFNVVHVAALGDLWAAGGERGVYKTDGRRPHVAARAARGRRHRRDRAGDGSAQQQDALRRHLPAASRAVGHERRRSGQRHLEVHRRRRDLGEARDTACRPGPRAASASTSTGAIPTSSTRGSSTPAESGVYRSDDGGASWRKLSDVNPRPMYFSQIRIDPQTDSRIYVLGVQLHVSDDGGKTFRADGAERIHVDHHAMWINPNDPRHLIIGNDGGVSISHDRAATWVWLPNLLAAQAYHVEFDMQSPYHVCAGLQDNNTWCGPSAVRTNSGIHNDDWYVISGGDGFQPLMDPTDSNIVYGESQDGRMSRIDRTTNERTVVRPGAARAEALRASPPPTASTGTRRCSSRRSIPRPSTSARTWC